MRGGVKEKKKDQLKRMVVYTFLCVEKKSLNPVKVNKNTHTHKEIGKESEKQQKEWSIHQKEPYSSRKEGSFII